MQDEQGGGGVEGMVGLTPLSKEEKTRSFGNMLRAVSERTDELIGGGEAAAAETENFTAEDAGMERQEDQVGAAANAIQPGRDLNAVIEDLFTYHNDPESVPHYVEVREAAKAFAKVILRHTPVCADQSAAIRQLRQCVMTANAAIALNGRGL